ncbi:MAG: hypothetical protein EOP21_11170, partial [Hyphomicrobiales bacterium]
MIAAPPDWASVRAILALAVFEPILPAIGVARSGDALRKIMRQHYAPTAGQPLDNAALAADYKGAVDAVAGVAGTDAAARFEAWARSRFTGLHAVQPALSGWIEALRVWAFARDLPGELRPPEASLGTIMEIASA